jgi:Flp pilus assembly protein TadG
MTHVSTKRRSSRKGFTLVFVALCIVALIAGVGIAVDIGRAYIVKGETQVFSDSAALAATMELDGTSAGIERARAQVAANSNRWNFNTRTFSNPDVAFAKSSAGPWESNPLSPNDYRYARVTAQAPVPLFFMPVLGGSTSSGASGTGPMALILFSPTMSIRASSAGGQELKTSFVEGLFPFSPYAHSPIGPHFGLELGQKYTLRWAANPQLNANTCPGDNLQSLIDLNAAGGGEERGYIEYNSAAIIRQSIEGDYQSVSRGIGDSVVMTG